MRWRALGLTALTMLAGATAAAAERPPARADDQSNRGFALSLGGAKLAEDYFLQVGITGRLTLPDVPIAPAGSWFSEAQVHPLRLGFYVPLNYRIADAEPHSEGTFRGEDWDEAAEYLRTIRSVEYGDRFDGIHFRFGELVGSSIGHQTIVDSYHNSLDLQHFHWGADGDVNALGGGVEWVVDDVSAPQLLGMRAFIRPFYFADHEAALARLAFGVSAVSDVSAPVELKTDAAGAYVHDDTGNFEVARDDAATLVGVDVEYPLFPHSDFTVTPYVDGNLHVGRGAGLHVGSFLGWAGPGELALDGRAEIRWLGADHLPAYFGPLYSVERFAYREIKSGSQQFPKLQWLKFGAQQSRAGHLTELGFGWRGLLDLRVNYAADFDAPTGVFTARAAFTPGSVTRVGLYYARSGLDRVGDFAQLDDALVVGELRLPLGGPMYGLGQVSRRWQLDENGSYRPADEFALSVGASFAF